MLFPTFDFAIFFVIAYTVNWLLNPYAVPWKLSMLVLSTRLLHEAGRERGSHRDLGRHAPLQNTALSAKMSDIDAVDPQQAAQRTPPVDSISSWTLLGTAQAAST
jgi:hypothetical protein